MVRLYDESTDQPCGTLTDSQFQALVDTLEEEGAGDQDYYVNRATIEMLEQQAADAGLIDILRAALGSREEMDIRWERD